MAENSRKAALASWPLLALAVLMIVGGAALLFGGAYLITLGGSWYFALAGAGLLLSAFLIATSRAAGLWVFAVVFIGTILWAVWEVGFSFWPLVSRLFAPGVLAVLVLLAAPSLHRGTWRLSRAPAYGLALLVVVGLGATVYRAFNPGPLIAATGEPAQVATADLPAQPENWEFYGRKPSGTRYAPQDQITPENVGQLEVAWTFRTGDAPINATGSGAEDQNTPIQIGDTVYVCTVSNIVYALDADTGEERWKFDPQASSPLWQRCRGVGYYESTATTAPAAPDTQTAPDAVPAPDEEQDAEAPAPQAPVAPVTPQVAQAPSICATRIVLSTIDARLIQLDAKTGELCPQFGDNGTVDLKLGMGEVRPGFYFQTSSPTVANGIIIIGGWVVDNVSVGLPSGVVRGFDAETGELLWAWDLGNPNITRLPPEGESYTRGTPNVWSTPAFDAELGLVYLPTGNATPDFFGGHRTEAAEEYTASIVALDIRTGRERWKFQTVHHDLWDYDVPAQPALYDVPDGNGGTTPALIQITKRGQTFVLDRRTGEPITEVEERPVPQGAVEGDWTAPTQPYSVGMPAIGVDRLTEASMWGATPFDQLYCRIEFRKMRYEGEFTPPGLTPSLQWPGFYGGMNWGSASVHEPSGYLIVNDTRSPHRVQLVPREDADREDARSSHEGLSAQLGTPYGAAKVTFMSPLGIPCQNPPYGSLTAIDMATKQIAWQVPLGTVEDTGPLGIKMHMAIPVGMPTVGGPISTASGLVFYAGTLDYNIRGFDLATGAELWKHRLPVGAQATPITYTSPKSGKQYVVVSAGGARQSPDRGDYIIAFKLPDGE
ncbi:membrane-bound PQQ-dependent dehydrogenase, glucose/quinate/shikimate family [Aquamicrobium sp. LC103]|uniref:membrane-bound PQQ-dependent dehydrogenase, glucose/quinate/shikimate family n=1 Tax=Aquamicrobium sp. LC103 TaxID=1120658 RepID=UPI00063E721E|nr:membrane-bound PQQ-dependent dehydrogenase, glucose/quinate/shikimate family [Aquamicrobium sp. LC103]TKT74707.1 membrane-bound PQQ-dependent dehydrogenase, glucose/quinate/shikimate family [Aquamicrobium sp. LC103]